MAGYAKVWTDIFNDPWFVGLSGLQRGVWLQLIVMAKHRGDSGTVCSRGVSTLSTELSLGRSTVSKILSLFTASSRINIKNNDNGSIEIKLLNYEHWQRVKRVGKSPPP